jgi:prepilin-type N-terminal cleavage/methylation domain-containing protein
MNIVLENRITPRRSAFTLVELLVVISIIGVLAALIIPVAGAVSRQKKINTAQAEMQTIETALENYKAKYGVYPPADPANSIFNSLYYELSGVTNVVPSSGTASYQTLDSISIVPVPGYQNQFLVGGVINCSKGSGEDTVFAKNFLPGLKATEWAGVTNNNPNSNPNSTGTTFNYLVTSVGGPDPNSAPFGNNNPFRYAYPGTNNPNSYDLWIQLSINSTPSSPKKYLVCNWTQEVLRNSPLP